MRVQQARFRVPDAAQRGTVRCRAGTQSHWKWAPVLQRIIACRAAPGERHHESAFA
ncbi:hypothetical protein DFP91_0099 [Pseudorhodoplanes sinuspersici]|nr:hypothetical protein DFP91_0099 [Pseudorhodoplanes sinuspersici]